MRQFKKGATDLQVDLCIIDSTAGTPETGVAYDTSSLALWYRRDKGAKVVLTATQLTALTNAHLTGGILHISDGIYRLDLPDAVAVNSTGVLHFSWGGTCTGMIIIGGEAELVDDNLSGLSARLPTALTGDGNIKADALKVNGATPLDGDATVAAIFAGVADGTGANETTVQDVFKVILAMAKGVIVNSSGDLIFQDADGDALFTLTPTAGGRTVS